MNRSYLMVAGDKRKHLDKIPELQCDVAMINLEDGVANKTKALELLFRRFSWSGMRVANKTVIVRINPLEETGEDEIKVLNTLKPDAIRIPKIKTEKDVLKACELIDEDIEIHLSVETKEALENLKKLKVDKRVTTVYLGILDMFESLGFPQSLLTLTNPTVEYILSKFLVDAKLAGLYPISFTYQDYKNVDEFRLWCEKVKAMGYTAKATISPTQVNIVNEVFGYNDEQIQKAEYIKKAFEKEKANGCTGFVDEKYGFIDEPIYKDALLVLRG